MFRRTDVAPVFGGGGGSPRPSASRAKLPQGSAHVYSLLDGLEEKAVQKRESAGICSTIGKFVCLVFIAAVAFIMYMGMKEESEGKTFDPNSVHMKAGYVDDARRKRLENYVLKSQQEQYKTHGRIHLSCHSPGFLHFVGRMKVGESVTVICPEHCYSNPWVKAHAPLVWGTQVYTDNSMLCLAALHSTSYDGAVYRVSIVKGEAKYSGSSKNHVDTASYGNHHRSFTVKYVDKGSHVPGTKL
jgi:hypothetical protein